MIPFYCKREKAYRKDEKKMTQNERELMEIINACEDKEEAIKTAVAVILTFLKEHGEDPASSAEDPRERI